MYQQWPGVGNAFQLGPGCRCNVLPAISSLRSSVAALGCVIHCQFRNTMTHFTGVIMCLRNDVITHVKIGSGKPEGFLPHLWRSRKNPSSWYLRVSKLESQRCHYIPILAIV